MFHHETMDNFSMYVGMGAYLVEPDTFDASVYGQLAYNAVRDKYGEPDTPGESVVPDRITVDALGDLI
jgi:hypothetical protein